MLFRNKKAGEKIMSLVWISAMIIIGFGIAWGVGIFYSAEVDVQNVEAEILSNRIMNCIFEQGFLIGNLLESDFDIFRECKLNKKVIESDFYFKISFLDEKGEKIREDISGGILEGVCTTTDSEGCVQKERSIIYAQDNKIKKGRMKILTASNQFGISSIK